MPNFANRTLFHCDNLPVLRGMNSGCVDLIATDPPFNKGRDFHATPDSLASGAKFQDRWSWADDVEGEWIDQIRDDWPAVWEVIDAARHTWGDDMGAFLCFMAVRVVEMRRVLADTGSLYLHCDPTACHYLKLLLDGVFGRRNFRNEIVWCYTGPGNVTKHFKRKHDTILYYARTKEAAFDRDAVRVPYSAETMARRGRAEGIRGIVSSSAETTEKRGADEAEARFGAGKVPEDWWSDVPALTNQRERTGYPTQKPLALYERIIKASSNEGDLVLDPFAGCATTPVAAERLGRRWAGCDIWTGAHELVLQRLQAEGLAASELDETDDRLFTLGDVTYTDTAPVRTDEERLAAPFLQVTERYAEPGRRMSRKEMVDYLVAQHRQKCQGCDRVFDDPRYLELDHNTPRADGGINHITNRVLLCGPCNRTKAHTLTLSGLRKQNRRNGHMADQRAQLLTT